MPLSIYRWFLLDAQNGARSHYQSPIAKPCTWCFHLEFGPREFAWKSQAWSWRVVDRARTFSSFGWVLGPFCIYVFHNLLVGPSGSRCRALVARVSCNTHSNVSGVFDRCTGWSSKSSLCRNSLTINLQCCPSHSPCPCL